MARWNLFSYYSFFESSNPSLQEISLSPTVYSYLQQIQKLWQSYFLDISGEKQIIYNFKKGKLKNISIDIQKIAKKSNFTSFWGEFIEIISSVSTLKRLSVCNLSTHKTLFQDFDWLEMIGKCRNLHSLDIFNISLEKVPEFIQKMPNLRHIGLDGNSIYEIPDFILNLKNLNSMSIAENKIERLPNWGNPKLFSRNYEYLRENSYRSFSGFGESGIIAIICNYFNSAGGSSLHQIFDKYLPYNLTPGGMMLLRKTISSFTNTHLILSLLNRTPYCKPYTMIKKKCEKEIKEILQYYEKSPDELVKDLIQGKNLTESEINRIIHECNWKERHLLENNLPKTHPILKFLNSNELNLSLKESKSLLL